MTIQLEVQEKLETQSLKNLPKPFERFLVTANGKYMWLNPICPFCKSRYVVHNGYYACEDSLVSSLGLQIRQGHYLCRACKKTFSTRFPGLDLFLHDFRTFLEETCFHLFVKGLTFGAIGQYFQEHYNIPMSDETARQSYLKITRKYRDEKVLESSGKFCIDCQHLKVNGNKAVRLSIVDAVTKKCLVDIVVEAENNEEIIDRLRLHLLPYEIKGFVVDGKGGLKEALEKEFGVPVQLCVMHFQKLIVMDYEKAYGKTLSLLQLRNQYLLLSILMDHDAELQVLDKKLEELGLFKSQVVFQNNQLRAEVLANEEKKLIRSFYEFRESLYRHRRKQEQYLVPRTEKEMVEKFRRAKMFLIEKHEIARLVKMEEEWKALTRFLYVKGLPPTNNTVEHYYAKTLTKTKKKQFRAIDALKQKIAACRAVYNKWFIPTVTLRSLLQQYAKLLNLFPT